MASTIIQPVADHLGQLLEGIGCKVNVWPRTNLPKGAAAMAEIELPDIARTDPEGSESQLGADDWHLEFLVTIWVNLSEATIAQQRLVELIEAWIAAVDADRGLGTLALDASVGAAKRVYQLENSVPKLVGYETTVAVWKLV